jgi:hypothetical protein
MKLILSISFEIERILFRTEPNKKKIKKNKKKKRKMMKDI